MPPGLNWRPGTSEAAFCSPSLFGLRVLHMLLHGGLHFSPAGCPHLPHQPSPGQPTSAGNHSRQRDHRASAPQQPILNPTGWRIFALTVPPADPRSDRSPGRTEPDQRRSYDGRRRDRPNWRSPQSVWSLSGSLAPSSLRLSDPPLSNISFSALSTSSWLTSPVPRLSIWN